jgi:peptidyl carrier protein
MSRDDVAERLISFIRERFLGGDPKNELDAQVPLLEWGVLDSLNTAVLLTFIRDDLGVTVPPAEISARNFKTVDRITDLILELGGVSMPTGGQA